MSAISPSSSIDPGASESASDYVPIELLRSLSRINGWRVAGAIAINWSLIIGALYVALRLRHPLAYALAFPIVANRQYALLLLVHECAHYLFRRRSEQVGMFAWASNDLIGNLFCAWPVGITVQRYRELHFKHHKHLGSDRDPDYEYYKERVTPARLTVIVLGGLLGIRALLTGFLYYAADKNAGPARVVSAPPAASLTERLRSMLGVAATQALILGVFSVCGHPFAYFFLWLLPVVSVVPTLNHLRTIVEHSPEPELAHGVAKPITRSNLANLFERELLGPVQFFYHHEHHAFPSVPFYQLKELHCALVAARYYDSRGTQLRGSYLMTLVALSRRPGQSLRSER